MRPLHITRSPRSRAAKGDFDAQFTDDKIQAQAAGWSPSSLREPGCKSGPTPWLAASTGLRTRFLTARGDLGKAFTNWASVSTPTQWSSNVLAEPWPRAAGKTESGAANAQGPAHGPQGPAHHPQSPGPSLWAKPSVPSSPPATPSIFSQQRDSIMVIMVHLGKPGSRPIHFRKIGNNRS